MVKVWLFTKPNLIWHRSKYWTSNSTKAVMAKQDSYYFMSSCSKERQLSAGH